MNKRQILASINEIANELDKRGLYSEANSLTNVMKRIAEEEKSKKVYDPWNKDNVEPEWKTRKKESEKNKKETYNIPIELLGDTVSKLNGYKNEVGSLMGYLGGYSKNAHPMVNVLDKKEQELSRILNSLLHRFQRVGGFIKTQVENVMPSVETQLDKMRGPGYPGRGKMVDYENLKVSFSQFVSNEKSKYAKYSQNNQAIREYLKSLEQIKL